MCCELQASYRNAGAIEGVRRERRHRFRVGERSRVDAVQKRRGGGHSADAAMRARIMVMSDREYGICVTESESKTSSMKWNGCMYMFARVCVATMDGL